MTAEEQLILALAEVERLRKAVARKNAEISRKDTLLSLKDAEIKRLSDTLLWLRRKVFGKMSEKNLPLDPDQLLPFEQEHMTDGERAQLNKEVEAADDQNHNRQGETHPQELGYHYDCGSRGGSRP